MERRYALLDDNQMVLEDRLRHLRRALPPLIGGRACAAVVIGSVAEGKARDRSDIDLLIVLRQGQPVRSDYLWWEREVATGLAAILGNEPFPVQPVIVGRAALTTSEQHLRAALRTGIVVWDPEGLLDDQPDARA